MYFISWKRCTHIMLAVCLPRRPDIRLLAFYCVFIFEVFSDVDYFWRQMGHPQSFFPSSLLIKCACFLSTLHQVEGTLSHYVTHCLSSVTLRQWWRLLFTRRSNGRMLQLRTVLTKLLLLYFYTTFRLFFLAEVFQNTFHKYYCTRFSVIWGSTALHFGEHWLRRCRCFVRFNNIRDINFLIIWGGCTKSGMIYVFYLYICYIYK